MIHLLPREYGPAQHRQFFRFAPPSTALPSAIDSVTTGSAAPVGDLWKGNPTMIHSSRRLMQTAASGAAALALVLSLSGCSGSNKNTVCNDAVKVLNDGTSEITGAMSKAATGDITPLNTAFSNVSTKFTELAGKAEDPALKAAVTGAAEAFGSAKLAGKDISALSAIPTKISDAGTKLSAACR